MTRSVAVFGIGNVLIGDDAAGPSIIRHLDALWEFPEGVFLEDLGTPSLDLAARMAGFEAVIFVDAVSASAEPGEIRQYTREEIIRNPPSLRMSPHDPSLKETLILVELLPDAPRYVTLIGIVPRSLEQFGLSDVVRAAVPRAAARVLAQLAALGIAATPRVQATVPATFWDAA